MSKSSQPLGKIVTAKKVVVVLNDNLKPTWDKVTDRNIKTLHPKIRKDAELFINRCDRKLGVQIRIYMGTRTIAEQNKLYAKGRITAGDIITNAKGGQSYHNYGLAFDCVEIRDGIAIWNNPKWRHIAIQARDFGFQWGGEFKRSDKPHFQNKFGFHYNDLKYKIEQGLVDKDGFVVLD